MGKAILWGTGVTAKKAIAKVEHTTEFSVTSITSGFALDSGTRPFGLEFVCSENLKDKADHSLIIASESYSEIVNEIYKNKLFPLDRIYLYGDDELLNQGFSNKVAKNKMRMGQLSRGLPFYFNELLSPVSKLIYISLNEVVKYDTKPEIHFYPTPPCGEMKSFLFVPYFRSDNSARQREIDYCLEMNLRLGFFDVIYVMSDSAIHTFDIPKGVNVRVISYERRVSYVDWIDLINQEELEGIAVLANADIFFTRSVCNLRQIFNSADKSSLFLAISRYELESEIAVLHSCPHYSQDVWAIHTDSLGKLENRAAISKVSMGSMRCDSKLAYLFKDLGFDVVNPCKFVHSVHFHKSNFRTYSYDFNYQNLGASLFVFPSEGMTDQSLQQLVFFDKAPSHIIGVRTIQLP